MTEIQKLEKELAAKKHNILKEKWEIYLNDMENFLNKYKGKVFLKHTSNGGFYMFKVLGFKQMHYANRQGFNGQWSPERWFEVQTSDYLTFQVADHRGEWNYGAKIKKDGLFANFITEQKMSLINKGYGGIPQDIIKVGYCEFTDNPADPNMDRASNMFFLATRIVPNEIYEQALAICNKHIEDVKSFWEINNPIINNLERPILK